jgi:hypothetical protein
VEDFFTDLSSTSALKTLPERREVLWGRNIKLWVSGRIHLIVKIHEESEDVFESVVV